LLDVLEHIDDDVGALRAAVELLRPGGLLLVTVPALPWLWSAHDVSVHHKRRYTKGTLRDLLAQADVRIEWLSYHTTLLLPVLATQRLVSRVRGIDPKAKYDVKLPPAPVNAAFRGVMALEARLLERLTMPIGSSLVAACVRR
jgi:2-polyprenyl-3-methyl-5-hydroxy-6-metoxy-1,4-benzoquinol methylase